MNPKLKKLLLEIDGAFRRGDLATVKRHCIRGRQRFPDDPLLLYSWSRLHLMEGRTEQARQMSAQALAKGGLKWLPVVAHHIDLLHASQENEAALNLLRQAAKVAVNPAPFEQLLAHDLCLANRRAEALPLFERLVATEPTAHLLNTYAYCLFDLGEQDAAWLQMRLAMGLDPNNLVLRSNGLLQAHYLPDMSSEKLLDLHREWFQICARLHARSRTFSRLPLNDRPLRVGFISNGFYSHPAGWMSFGSLKMLATHCKTEVYLYSTSPPSISDSVCEHLQTFATKWLSVYGWTTDSLLDQLLQDNLDILVDMAGHSEHSAIPVIAARAAPVQVKWVGGLFNTSAVPNMDYLLSDWLETPEGAETNYMEALVRLPGGYVTYTPPSYMPAVTSPPALEQGYVTFSCFNNIYKINPQIAGVWARILQAVPASRLKLKDKRLGDPEVCRRMEALFASAGINPERLELNPGSPHSQLLQSYQQVDIALDPWPYSGGLTTVEALYMGVPVVTCPGPTFAGRHAASHVNNVGLGNWIAKDFDEYVAIAVDWASRLEDLAALRTGLRQRCQQSPLCDHLQFAEHLDRAFRVMFEQWEKGVPPVGINFTRTAQLAQLPEEGLVQPTELDPPPSNDEAPAIWKPADSNDPDASQQECADTVDKSDAHPGRPKTQECKQASSIKKTQHRFKICVGIPVYNEAGFIEETVKSAQSQDIDDVLFLISDNCSNDGSYEKVLSLTHEDARFRILRQPRNVGGMNNGQLLFHESDSRYFMWLGGHDKLSSGFLAETCEILDHHPEISMATGLPAAMDENGKHLGIVENAIYDFKQENRLARYFQSVAQLANCTCFHSLFRRDCLNNFEFRPTLSPDHVLISHLLWHGKLHYCNGEQYIRRYFSERTTDYEERITGNKKPLQRIDFLQYYLDDFEQLHVADERIHRYLLDKLINIIDSRFGAIFS